MSDQNQLGDGPIDSSVRTLMQSLARGIDETINPRGVRNNGFVLMVFPTNTPVGRSNYIANVQRKDVIQLLRSQLARFEAQEATENGNDKQG